MSLAMGCQRAEIDDQNDPDARELRFSPNLGQAQTATRAAESDNSILMAASAEGATGYHIVIDTYTGTPGSSLKSYFADELGYFATGKYWDLNSKKIRFLPQGGMNLYAYFATKYPDKADLTNVNYTKATSETKYPKLTFEVADEGASQVDLIAAKVENITYSDVPISMSHILSQINFGVKGIGQHQITVKNIRVNNVKKHGSFDYNTWQWSDITGTANYSYYFPDRKEDNVNSGQGDNYKTLGVVDDSQNNYIFGDGGKFGPGKYDTFLYAQADLSVSNYETAANTLIPLHNSLMLMPQQITKNADATVTFDYDIKFDNQPVRSATNSTVRLNTYHDWKPNMRYVYIFKFDDPEKVTFDVIVEPWQNYDGDEGIVDSDELNAVSLFEKYVRPLKPGGEYVVPMGTLTSDFLCDWSLYTVDNSFAKNQQFTLSFEDDVPFTNGKSIVITPPFGFKASTSKLSKSGKVTFTAIHSYYPTTAELNAAIGNSGNHEVSVRDVVKLEDITFSGSTTAESSLTLHYLARYNGTRPDRWQMYNETTAVCFPKDFSLISNSPYTYTVYNMVGLSAVLNWMDTGLNSPDGTTTTLDYAERMKTNINLAKVSSYNLAEVYKSSGNADKPEFIPIGNETNPYSGTFNGNGATISNLYINSSYIRNRQGFFGTINDKSKIKHLSLTNVSITSGDWYVGGLIGFNSGGTVTGCSVQGTIQGAGVTGGIVGQNNGFIYSSSSTATISGGTFGGVAGDNWGMIETCYVTNGSTIAGADHPDVYNPIRIVNSYYVASSDIGINPTDVTRVPSIAALNGKIPMLNTPRLYVNPGSHFVYGDLNTPPVAIAGEPAPRQGGGVLKGTFIQNWFAISWNETQWDTEMALLASLGMEYLVIDQVMECLVPEPPSQAPSKYMAWYPASSNIIANVESPALEISSGTALEKCMKACRAHGIKLFIGTFFDKRYWDGGAAVNGKKAQWVNCITTANSVMNDLITQYFHDGANNYKDVLAGWYFPYEVDDLSFQTDEAQTILKDGIRSAMTFRDGHNVDGRKPPYLFSPFMNGESSIVTGTMTAAEYEALWRDIVTTAGLKSGDILSPQDCIGVGKLTIPELATWMPALQRAASATAGVEFWINLELFGVSNTSLLITEQIPASNKPYVSKLISFSYPIYYSPNSGYKQGDHNAYKAYYDAQ